MRSRQALIRGALPDGNRRLPVSRRTRWTQRHEAGPGQGACRCKCRRRDPASCRADRPGMSARRLRVRPPISNIYVSPSQRHAPRRYSPPLHPELRKRSDQKRVDVGQTGWGEILHPADRMGLSVDWTRPGPSNRNPRSPRCRAACCWISVRRRPTFAGPISGNCRHFGASSEQHQHSNSTPTVLHRYCVNTASVLSFLAPERLGRAARTPPVTGMAEKEIRGPVANPSPGVQICSRGSRAPPRARGARYAESRRSLSDVAVSRRPNQAPLFAQLRFTGRSLPGVRDPARERRVKTAYPGCGMRTVKLLRLELDESLIRPGNLGLPSPSTGLPSLSTGLPLVGAMERYSDLRKENEHGFGVTEFDSCSSVCPRPGRQKPQSGSGESGRIPGRIPGCDGGIPAEPECEPGASDPVQNRVDFGTRPALRGGSPCICSGLFRDVLASRDEPSPQRPGPGPFGVLSRGERAATPRDEPGPRGGCPSRFGSGGGGSCR